MHLAHTQRTYHNVWVLYPWEMTEFIGFSLPEEWESMKVEVPLMQKHCVGCELQRHAKTSGGFAGLFELLADTSLRGTARPWQ